MVMECLLNHEPSEWKPILNKGDLQIGEKVLKIEYWDVDMNSPTYDLMKIPAEIVEVTGTAVYHESNGNVTEFIYFRRLSESKAEEEPMTLSMFQKNIKKTNR